MGVQLPRLVLGGLDLEGSKVATLEATLQSPKVTAGIRNYGATIAFLDSVGFELFCGAALPAEPDYSLHAHDVEPETALQPNHRYFLSNASYRPFYSSETIKEIRNQTRAIWVY